jgi:DNA processing protein
VESAQDILEELRWTGPEPVPAAAASKADLAEAESDGERALLAQMGFDPLDLDTLVARMGLTPESVFAILTVMELEGRVARLPGGRFQRIN